MNSFTFITTLLAVVTLSSSSIVSPVNKSGNFELLILHNNDMHARFEQTSQLSGTCTVADRDAGKCYGGFPRVAYVVKEARKAAASGEGLPVLYLNAGDTYTGTAWFTIYKWRIAAEFINALQPDAVSPGNDDFDVETSGLSPLLQNLNTKILSSNVIPEKSEDKKKLQSSVVFNMEGTKVGIVGYLTPDQKVLEQSSKIEYIDEVIALKEEVARLLTQDVNIILAIGHSSPRKNIDIATEVEGIDAIITGYQNQYFWNGTSADNFKQIKDVTVVTQPSGKRVPIFHSYAYNKYLGKLSIKFDTVGEIVEYNAEPILLDSKIPQEPEYVNIARNYLDEISTMSTEVLGNTAVVLDGDSCKTDECNLGNFITDAVMYYYAVRFEGERWTDAPIAIIPGGTIATSIAPTNRPAPVTRGDVLSALPSETNLVTVTMNGNILMQLLEHSVSNYSMANPTGQFLQYSGIRVVYDLSRESGSRVVSIVARCWSCFVPEFYTIDDWRDYKILMPASLANGEYGYSMLVGLPRDDIGYDAVTCTEEYINLRSPVYPEVAGRIELLSRIDDTDTDTDIDTDIDTDTDTDTDTDSATTISATVTILFVVLISQILS